MKRVPFQAFHSSNLQQSNQSNQSNQSSSTTNQDGTEKNVGRYEEGEEEILTKDPNFNEPSWNPSNEEDEGEMEIIPTENLPFTFIDDTDSSSTISSIISSTDLYSHQVFPRSKEDIAEQQALFDTFIRQLDQLCDETERGGKVIVMKPHRLSGLGNNIRTIMTGMYLAVATDRGMRCRSLK